MALQLQYSGSFVGVRGTVWRADLLVEGHTGSVEELTFPARRPLEIEWKVTGKEEVVCGSTATLRIESPGDRTYTELYTVKPGCVQLQVWRAGVLWWVGDLDPEFYEEPYERADSYDVTLTFQDFGLLERLRFAGSGMVSIGQLLTDALTRCGLGALPVMVSTGTSVGSAAPEEVLDDVSVMAANLYDEDGEAMTLGEALKGVLQPLGMRLVQRGGHVWLYDLDTLYNGHESLAVVWSGTRQTLGVDRTANKVTLTWSPYVQGGVLAKGECWVSGLQKHLTNLWNKEGLDYGENKYWTMHHQGDRSKATLTDYGFTLWTSEAGKGATLVADGLRYFKMVPHLDGEEGEGVALVWGVGAVDLWQSSNYHVPYYYGHGVGTAHSTVPTSLLSYTYGHAVLLRTIGVSLPPALQASQLQLRVKVDMLLDVRFNPFVEAVDFETGVQRKEKQMYAQWTAGMNFVCVPVRLRFDPADGGSPLYWKRGLDIVQQGSTGMAGRNKPLSDTYGEWVTEDSIGWLMWYDAKDRSGGSGVLGWKANRQGISPTIGELDGLFGMLESGQYLPYPGTGRAGTLTMEVLDHWYCLGTDGTFDSDGVTYTKLVRCDGSNGLTNHLRWALMKLPQVEVVKAHVLDTELATDDVTYSGVINAHAREDVELDTVCGTARYDRELARGIYVTDGEPVRNFLRAGRLGGCEELLIGTLHSQWAERHVKLSGEMEEQGEGLVTYIEANQNGVKLMKVGEVVDAIGEVTDATLVELSPDEYDKA